LQDKLLREDLFEEFCDEFTRGMNRLRMEHRASLSATDREIERIEVQRKKLVESIMEGVPASEVKDELNTNAARREELKAKLAADDAPPPLLHPEMAGQYRQKVTALSQALEHPETRTGACEALRGLIDVIVLTPNQKTLRSVEQEVLPAGTRGVMRWRVSALRRDFARREHQEIRVVAAEILVAVWVVHDDFLLIQGDCEVLEVQIVRVAVRLVAIPLDADHRGPVVVP
jgi:hypothetical protein